MQEKKNKTKEKKKVLEMVEDDYLLRRQLTIIGNVERTKLFPFPMRENWEEKAGLDTPFVICQQII